MSLTPLEKSVLHVVKGIYSVEEFVERVVRAAVYETIQMLSDRYGLDQDRLKRELAPELIEKHSRLTQHVDLCTATTSRGKRCIQPAVCDHLCDLHYKKTVPLKKRKTMHGYLQGGSDGTVTRIMNIFTSATQGLSGDPQS